MHALGLLCCLVGLTWAKAACAQDSPAGQPGAAQAKKEESASASPPVAATHLATVPDAAVPAFGFRVTGRMFSIEANPGANLGANLGARSVMGTTLLPWPGREPPLIRGKAAYVVLPGNGLAVIDVGLARFPYVVWRLSPDLAVRSIAIEDQTLRVTTWQGTVQYDIRDPLQPRGPDTFAADPRRYYDASAAESGTADHTWEEQGAGWPQRGRRVYLRDGSTVLGTFHGLDLARDELTLEVMGQKRALSTLHILHVEPVFFGEVGTGTRSLAAGPGSRGAAKAAALLLGVPMVILYSAVVVTTIVVAVAIVICGPPVPYVSSRC